MPVVVIRHQRELCVRRVSEHRVRQVAEIRVVVEPDKVDDNFSDRLANDIAQKIQEEMQYPGQVKVVVIREVRKIAYAK